MARRGRCRCGTLLTFRRGPAGYKVRCPACGSVVRLSAPADNGAPPPVGALLPPPEPLPPLDLFGPTPPAAAGKGLPHTPADSYCLVETTPYVPAAPPAPPPPPPIPIQGRRVRWWLVAAVALIMSAVAGAVIWLCQR
jgi:hypothetical protein